ncbi:hypothetical protein M0638_12590 [Roseomonas sp. NAR14]|uniref:Uncharacterized protein n=1 Tax=Roseomonas acroporae TaxID=2937791 RepID=A0A9X1Y7Z8_9PROT|nr:hypothetical protein [Roseomonas acroporae]MCK8785223.1 hypothetical protein [Roseomonas acroporae]
MPPLLQHDAEGETILRGAPPVRIEPDGAVLERYIASPAKVKLIQGPVGSGKSTASWHALMANAFAVQRPWKGKRFRRTLVVRNTLKQIKDTVLPTKRLVMPEKTWGATLISGRPRHHIRMPGVDWEILFYGLDDPDSALEDLKSLEISDAYVSEARYVDRQIIVALVERVGRYPPVAWGGCTQPQVLGDTNPPEMGSWLSVISGQAPMPEGLSREDRMSMVKPADWEFHLQPSAVIEERDEAGEVTGYVPNPEAENLRFLPAGYYADKIGGRTKAEIDTELGNKPGAKRAGKAVWPQFRVELHGKRDLEPVRGHEILVGVDFGRTPAAAIGQCVFGQWRVLREIVTESMGAREFGRALKRSLAQWFPAWDYAVWGDPAGENMEQSDDVSPFLAMRAEGIRIIPAPGNNDWVVRRDAVGEVLQQLLDGRPRFLIDQGACPVLTAAMGGQYAYPRIQGSQDRYADRPLKNRFSHVADACQYLILGGGEGRALFQKAGTPGVGGLPREAPRRQVVVAAGRGRGWGGLLRGR